MSRRLFNYILSLFGINAQDEEEEDEEQQQHDAFPTETYSPEEDLILITQKQQQQQQHQRKNNNKQKKDPLLINPKSKSVAKKKKKSTKKSTTTAPRWLSIEYLLSMIREQEHGRRTSIEQQIEQPVDLISEEDDGTIISEFKSLRNQVTRASHALDTQRPSEQFANTTNVIMPLFYEKLNFITTANYQNHWYTLYAYIMLGITSLKTKGEVKRQVFSETDWSRTLILAMSSLLKNFDHSCKGGGGGDQERKRRSVGGSGSSNSSSSSSKREEEDEEDDNEVDQDELESRDVLLVLLDQLDWFSLLKQMCEEFERLDSNWQFKKEYVDVVEMAAQLKEYVNK